MEKVPVEKRVGDLGAVCQLQDVQCAVQLDEQFLGWFADARMPRSVPRRGRGGALSRGACACACGT